MTEETWAPIPSLTGQYLASSIGRIRRVVDSKIMPFHMNDGYLYVVIDKKHYRSHRLIAEAFFGPCPEGHHVCHINSVKHDNRIENLKYGTPSENAQDSIAERARWRGETREANGLPGGIRAVCIFERKPGVWRIRAETRDEKNNRVFSTFTVRGDRAEAEKARLQVLSGNELHAGVTAPSKAATNIQ